MHSRYVTPSIFVLAGVLEPFEPAGATSTTAGDPGLDGVLIPDATADTADGPGVG